MNVRTQYLETWASVALIAADLAEQDGWASQDARKKFQAAKAEFEKAMTVELKQVVRGNADDYAKETKTKAAKCPDVDKQIARKLQEFIALEERVTKLRMTVVRLNQMKKDASSP